MIKSKGRGRNLLSTKEITEEIERLKEEAQRRMDATNGIEEWMAEKFKSLKDRLKKYEEGASFHSNRHDDIGNRLEKLEKLEKLAANHEQFCNNYAAMLAGTLEKQESLQQEIKELKEMILEERRDRRKGDEHLQEEIERLKEWIEVFAEPRLKRMDWYDGHVDRVAEVLKTQEDKIKALEGDKEEQWVELQRQRGWLTKHETRVQSLQERIETQEDKAQQLLGSYHVHLERIEALESRAFQALETPKDDCPLGYEYPRIFVQRQNSGFYLVMETDWCQGGAIPLEPASSELRKTVELCVTDDVRTPCPKKKENNLEVIERAEEFLNEWPPGECHTVFLKILVLAKQSIKEGE
jgi:DNA repair exonuclease SbcCD ATPase subunit